MTRDYAIKYLQSFPEDDYLICVVFSRETVKEWLDEVTDDTELIVNADDVIDGVNDMDWSYDMEHACQIMAYEIIGGSEK